MVSNVPVFVVLQPNALLLDVAGPVEVLRRANDIQDDTSFAVHYVAPNQALEPRWD